MKIYLFKSKLDENNACFVIFLSTSVRKDSAWCCSHKTNYVRHYVVLASVKLFYLKCFDELNKLNAKY